MSIILTALRQLSPGDPVPTPLSNDRTTLGIIWSCLTTIFTCTWIAIHPNLPVNGERPFKRRLKIFVIALFAPELIVSWAIRQWWSSRRLAREYEKYGWTQIHSFFAIMGGFQVCDPDGSNCSTLDTDDLGRYLECRTLRVSAEEILDKSKGDVLSKALVLLQVSWFILQILPLDVHYPIKIYKQSCVTSTGCLFSTSSSDAAKQVVESESVAADVISITAEPAVEPIIEGSVDLATGSILEESDDVRHIAEITLGGTPGPIEYDYSYPPIISLPRSPALEPKSRTQPKSDSRLSPISRLLEFLQLPSGQHPETEWTLFLNRQFESIEMSPNLALNQLRSVGDDSELGNSHSQCMTNDILAEEGKITLHTPNHLSGVGSKIPLLQRAIPRMREIHALDQA